MAPKVRRAQNCPLKRDVIDVIVARSLTYQYQKVGIRCKDYIKVVYAILTCKVGIGDDKNSLRAIEIRFSAIFLLKARHFI